MNHCRGILWCLVVLALSLHGTPIKGIQPCPLNTKDIIYVRESPNGEKMLMLNEKTLAQGEAPRLSYAGKHVLFLIGGLFPEARIYDLDTRTIVTPATEIIPDREVMWTGKAWLVWQEQGKTRAYDVATRQIVPFPTLRPDTLALSPDAKLAVRAIMDGHETPALELYRIRSGKTLKTIRSTSGWKGAASGGAHSPAFSEDGNYLAWVDAGIQPLANIRMLNLKTGTVKTITTDGRDHQFPAFVPHTKPYRIMFSTLQNTSTILQCTTLDN